VRKRGPILVVAGLCVLFVAAGCMFIPRLGIQNDEVIFGAGLYEPLAYRYGIRIFHTRVPLMLLNYLGATKTWFYAAWFKLWPPSPASLRVPMLVAGAVSVWMFYRLLRRVAGERAALAGAALLATDPVYLLVTLWGPIISHHLLLVGVLLGALRVHATRSARWLAATGFLAGLGVWDKALFAWLLAAAAAGALAAAPRAVREALTWRNLRTAAVWFVLGAAPLLLFNLKSRGETLRGNAALSLDQAPRKAEILRYSLDGSLLFGWMVTEQAPPAPRAPAGAVEQASLWLAGAAGRRERDLLPWACGLALLLVPLLWRTPAYAPMVFGLVSFAVGWAAMLLTKDTGMAAHHTLLLWPLPQMAVAVALADASKRVGRGILSAAVVLAAGSNLLVTNQYLADAVRNGPGLDFTDAVYPLARSLQTQAEGQVFAADWGIVDSLRFLGRGKIRLRVASDLAAKESLTAEERDRLREWISGPGDIFVGHTAGREFNPGSSARLRRFAEENGYASETLAVVRDSFGRPTYEVFRFRRPGGW
jgi:hypothetical protein